jgi:hypothetical protein
MHNRSDAAAANVDVAFATNNDGALNLLLTTKYVTKT